jgi:nitroreductase
MCFRLSRLARVDAGSACRALVTLKLLMSSQFFPVSEEAVLNALQWRYATKKFDPSRKIPEQTWRALQESIVLSPSSFGLQPWRFVWVRDRSILEKLPAVSWNQTQPVDCSHYVVFAQRKDLSVADVDHFVDRIAEVRGVSVESLAGYRGFMLNTQKTASEQGWINPWSARQVYIALGQAMAAAALLGIDTCAMEGIDPSQYDALLDLPSQGYTTLCGLAFGYRAADDKYASTPKVRFPLEEVFHTV